MSRILSDVLGELAPEAVIGVFASYGVHFSERVAPAVRGMSIAPRAPDTSGAMVAGVVGFTGVTMRGTLLLATTFELIATARPAEIRGHALSKNRAADWILVRDWAGELANQVLGRIKNRLRRFGVTFDVSPPAALSGPALTFAAPKGPAPQHRVFVAGQHKVWYCLDAFFDPSQKLAALGGETEAQEGRVIVFD